MLLHLLVGPLTILAGIRCLFLAVPTLSSAVRTCPTRGRGDFNPSPTFAGATRVIAYFNPFEAVPSSSARRPLGGPSMDSACLFRSPCCSM